MKWDKGYLAKGRYYALSAYGIRYYSLLSTTTILTSEAFASHPNTVIVP
jgi:hypothetical protein